MATAVLLLLCQTAFVAQACAHSVVAIGSGPVSTPCHDTPDDGTTGAPPAPSGVSVCEAGKAVGDSTKVQLYTLADLPAVPVAYLLIGMPRISSAALQTVHAVCYSPPLSILHCRFIK